YKLLLDYSVPLIKASTFWNNGYNGTGIKVCVLDTGINKTHSALSSRVIAEKDFVIGDWDGDNPQDYSGHGTHVAGIVASTDSTYKGVAPGTSILNAKVFTYYSNLNEWLAPTSAIMSGIDWCISQGADILTLSLGGPEDPNDGSDILSQYVDLAVDQGKVVTIAAGNSGPNNGTINCPGCAHKVISVGSTQTNKWLPFTTQDSISDFSSRGPTADGRIEPDVTAPGEPITSSWYNGGWNTISGTSMATPHVAGLSALVLQTKPSLTPEEVKALLMNSANDLGTSGKDNSYGAGRINAEKTFNEISNTRRDIISTTYKVHNIFVPSGSTEIRAVLYWPENYSLHNDVDLYLLDPAGNIRTYSISSWNTDEMIKLTSPTPSGNWKLLVNPYAVTGNQVYALASNFKPSDQRDIIVRNISQIVYHQINVTSSSKPLIVNFDWSSSTVDLDIYLYNTTGYLVNYSIDVNTNYEEVSVNNPNVGIWLVRLVPFNLAGNPQVQYTLTSSFAISEQISDTIPPIVTLLEPLNISYNKQNITSKFIVTENINKFVTCSRVVDGNSTLLGTIENNTIFTSYFSVADGIHSIYVTCSDGANNIGSSSTIYFSVDSVPPNITFISPSDPHNSFVNRSYTLINVSVNDASNIDTCILEWNGTNISMTKIGSGNSVNCFINKTDVDGTYNYRVYANDSLNNIGNSPQRTITFDTIYPSIISAQPSDNSYILGTDNQTLLVNYTEINLDYIQLYWNETWPYNISNPPINLSGCSSGVYQTCSYNLDLSKYLENDKIVFYFSVFDKTGKSSYLTNPQGQPYSVTIHRTPPYYSSIVQYPTGDPIYGQNVQLNSTWADVAGISKVFLESNYTGVWKNYTTLNQSSTYYYIISSSYLNGGKVVSWRFIANNSLDNWNTSMPYQSFTIQKATSSINILLDGTEDNKTYEKGQLANITAIVNVSDKPIIIEANFSGLSTPIAPGITTVTNITNTGNLILGIYNITAYFVGDENYTQSALTRYLTIQDTTPPTISNAIITPSIVKPNSNVTLIAAITDNNIVSYAYAIGYNSSWYQVYQPQNLTNSGNNWFLTFNVTDVPVGIYYFNITALDNSGNSRTVWADNITVNQTSGAINTFTNTSITTVNNQTIVDATQTTNTTLEIKTNQSVSNATVTIAIYIENPGTANLGIPALNKYLEITASSDLNNSLSWVIIKVYYNDSDIPSGYNESNLRIYYQNPDGIWIAYDGNLVGGVNTTANYVWANTTHFSIYGIFIKPTCDDGIQNQGETEVDCGGPCSACPSPGPSPGPTGGGGAGGGGGGGGAAGPEVKPCLLNGICDSWETPETCPTDCKKVPTPKNVTETTIPTPPKPTEENKTAPTNITGPTPTQTAGVPAGFAVLVPYLSNPITISMLIIITAIAIMYWKKLFIFKKETKRK
ncbi:MAG: S8 family peptidase, partial [Candidatus Aenigmatarchaeota archaeon]